MRYQGSKPRLLPMLLVAIAALAQANHGDGAPPLAAAVGEHLSTAGALGLSRAEYEDLDPLPGSDFMQKGFDATNDTVDVVVSASGQTSRLPVYKFNYAGAVTYTNPYTKVIYKVADQLSPTTNTESMEYVVEDISYSFSEVITSEISRFNIGVSLSYKNITATASFNHESARASVEMSNKSHVFAGSQKWWKLWDVTAYPPSLTGAVHPELTAALAALPKTIATDADRIHYNTLVKAWGTHYIVSANFGGRLIHNVYVDTDYYMSQSQAWVSNQINLNFHYDAFNVSGGGFSNKSDIHIDQDYAQHSSSVLFYEGGLPSLQENTTLGEWMATIPDVPHFLNATVLGKLSDVVADPTVQATLSGFIDVYLANAGGAPSMGQLRSQRPTVPPTTPPTAVPKPSTVAPVAPSLRSTVPSWHRYLPKSLVALLE